MLHVTSEINCSALMKKAHDGEDAMGNVEEERVVVAKAIKKGTKNWHACEGGNLSLFG